MQRGTHAMGHVGEDDVSLADVAATLEAVNPLTAYQSHIKTNRLAR